MRYLKHVTAFCFAMVVSSGAQAAVFDFFDYATQSVGGGFTNSASVVRPGGEADWDTIVGGVGLGILDVGSGISVVGSGSTSNPSLSTNAYFDNGAGLGVCTVLTLAGQCNPADDDNVGAIGGSSQAGDGTFEIITLTFNEKVNLSSVVFRAEGHGLFSGFVNINGTDTEIIGGTLSTSLASTVFDFQYVPVPFGTPGDSTNEFYIGAVTVAAVPLPAGVSFLIAGLGALGLVGRRRRRLA